VLDGYRRKGVRITAAKLDGTAICMDFTPPILNDDIIVFSVQKKRNHQSHYKAEGTRQNRKGGWSTLSSSAFYSSSDTTRDK
jgi:hypothetical protein